jgi:hypothetical protein
MKSVLNPTRKKLRFMRAVSIGLYFVSLAVVVFAHARVDVDMNRAHHPILAASYVRWVWVLWICTSIAQGMIEVISKKVVMSKAMICFVLMNFVSGIALLTFKHVILMIIPYSTLMYMYFLVKIVSVVFEKSLNVSLRAETDPIVGLNAAAKDEHASDTITRYLLYIIALTPGMGPVLSLPLLSLMKKKKEKKSF